MSYPANLRGWGPGWPVDRTRDMRWVRAARSGARWQVHHGIAPIVQFLVDEVERRGYLFDHGPDDTDDDWGYANRPIRGRNVPSNHSWGLAIDIDAQNYPMGTRRFPPAWIVALFEAYGFELGGRWSRPDPMHFEWQGSVTEARHMVAMLAASHVVQRPAPMPPVQMPAPAPPPPPSPVLEDQMFLRVNGLGLYFMLGDKWGKFATDVEWEQARKDSPGVPTGTIPADVARQMGLW